MAYDQYRNMPDDVRRDYADLRLLIESGAYVDDAEGIEHFETQLAKSRAEAIEARLDKIPHNIVFIQTEQGRYQIEIGKTLTITALDAGKHLVMTAPQSNRIELTQRFA